MLGHCAIWDIAVFAYLYHIMIFFFVAGCCIGEKHIQNPEQYIGRSLLKNGALLFAYNGLFVVLHNVFLRMNIMQGSPYGLSDMLRAILGGVTLAHSELFLGAFWFVPMYFVAVSLFVIVLHICNRLIPQAVCSRKGEVWTTRAKTVLQLLSCAAAIVVALALNYKKIQLNYHIQTSFLAIPVLFAGYFYKKHREKLERYVSVYGIVPAFLILWGILRTGMGIVELSIDSIINVWIFYPTTLVGIYFCMAVGKLLNKWKLTRGLFAEIGKCSFHIMALHFLCFKLVDLVYVWIHPADDLSILGGFPTSNFPVRAFYLLAGVLLPLLAVNSSKRVVKFMKKKLVG